METIDEVAFIDFLVSKEDNPLNDVVIDFKKSREIDISKIRHTLTFINCKFIGKRIDFLDSQPETIRIKKHNFKFENCEFLNEIYFKDCSVQSIEIRKISKQMKSIFFASITADTIILESNKSIPDDYVKTSKVHFHLCKIDFWLHLFHLQTIDYLLISGNEKINSVKIHDCNFNHVAIDNNEIERYFQFTSNLVKTLDVSKNSFENINFQKTNVWGDALFRNNAFSGTANFSHLYCDEHSLVSFRECEFHKYTYFNFSNFYNLEVDTSKFHDFASLQEITTHTLLLDRSVFEKPAFFDDLVIEDYSSCSKRTIRNIKQQLLRTDNKIDYDYFRSYELTSHKNELKQQLKDNDTIDRKKLRRDLSILRISHFYSNNGTDWFKSLKRTFIIGLIFYSLVFISLNYKNTFTPYNYENINNYFIGFFKFLLLTDFHNPLKEKEYLSHALEWIPLILGKVLIGIGLYETIISFRKFRK